MTTPAHTLRAALLWHIWHGTASPSVLETISLEHGANVYVATVQILHLKGAGLVTLADVPVAGQAVIGPELDAEEAAKREYARLIGARSCRVCGCSAAWGCAEGCCWAGPDLCSACEAAEAGVP